jgi:hypothetical protein
MRIVTSTVLSQKYGPSVYDLLKPLGGTVDILTAIDYPSVKCHMDTINDDILIIGGQDVIPFATLMNPASDEDQSISSDNPYACTKDLTYIIPDKIVTRIPDEQANWSLDYLTTVLNNQVMHINATTSPASGWFSMVASVWVNINTWFNQRFTTNNQNVVPPTIFDNLNQNLTQNKKFAILNLHGTMQTPFFYGQQGGVYPIALKPVLNNFSDTLIFSEACYGAFLNERNKSTSIPLMALYSGATGFVGSTNTAYGPPGPPPKAADLLAVCFFTHIAAGEPLGRAFMNAKIDFATQTIKTEGALDPESKKTMLQFVCFGHPGMKF